MHKEMNSSYKSVLDNFCSTYPLLSKHRTLTRENCEFFLEYFGCGFRITNYGGGFRFTIDSDFNIIRSERSEKDSVGRTLKWFDTENQKFAKDLAIRID